MKSTMLIATIILIALFTVACSSPTPVMIVVTPTPLPPLPVLPTATPNLFPTAASNPLGQATSTSNAAFQIVTDWGDSATNALVKVSVDNVYIGRIDGSGRLQYSTNPGTHSYYLYAEATLKDGTKYTGEGKGSIEVKANAEYLVRTASDAKVLMLVPK